MGGIWQVGVFESNAYLLASQRHFSKGLAAVLSCLAKPFFEMALHGGAFDKEGLANLLRAFLPRKTVFRNGFTWGVFDKKSLANLSRAFLPRSAVF